MKNRKLTLALIFCLPMFCWGGYRASAQSPGAAQYGANISDYPVTDMRSCQVAVGTSPTELKCTIVGWSDVRVRLIKNCSGAFDVGNILVASGAGYPLDLGEAIKQIVPISAVGAGTTNNMYGDAASAGIACILEWK